MLCTRKTGPHFTDRLTAPRFRIGAGQLSSRIRYSMPLQLVFTGALEPARITTGLMQAWGKLNNYRVKPIQVRTPPETLSLFL